MKRRLYGDRNRVRKEKEVLLIDDKEDYLEFEDVEQYQHDMIKFVLPNDVNVLMDHAHQLLLFIDEVHRITDRNNARMAAEELKKKNMLEKQRKKNNINNNNNNNNNNQNDDDMIIDKFAFLDNMGNSDDENEVSPKPKDINKAKKGPTEESEESTIDIDEDDDSDDDDDSDEENEYVKYGIVCNIVWNWYSQVKMKNEKTYQSLFITVRFYMWISFVRMFYLTLHSNREKHNQYNNTMVDDMEYFKQIRDYCYIELSSEVVGAYSINELWSSVRLTYRSLYNFSYTPAMKDFFHALFYRYANFVSCEQPARESIFDNPNFVETNTIVSSTAKTSKNKMLMMMAKNSNSMNILGGAGGGKTKQSCDNNGGMCDYDDDGEVFVDPSDLSNVNTVVELLDAFKAMSIKVNDRFSINNQFIMEGEKLFYHQIYRLRISSRLHLMATGKPLILKFGTPTARITKAQFPIECVAAWKEFLLTMCEDKKLRTFMINEFKQRLVDIHMYHGEKERYCEAFPDMADDFRQILQEMRADDLSYIEKTQLMTLRDIVVAFHAELSKSMEHSVDVNYRSISYELECILLTILSTKNWYQAKVVPSINKLVTNMVYDELCKLEDLDKIVRTIVEPRPVVTNNNNNKKKNNKKNTKKTKDGKRIVIPVQQKKKKPLFIKLMRIYYVVNNEGCIYTSFSFIESYMVWTALCVKYQFITSDKIHEKLKKTINKILTII